MIFWLGIIESNYARGRRRRKAKVKAKAKKEGIKVGIRRMLKFSAVGTTDFVTPEFIPVKCECLNDEIKYLYLRALGIKRNYGKQ